MGRTQEFVCRETWKACCHSNMSDRFDASEFSSLLRAFFLTGKNSNMSSIATLIRLKSYAKSVTKKGYGGIECVDYEANCSHCRRVVNRLLTGCKRCPERSGR